MTAHAWMNGCVRLCWPWWLQECCAAYCVARPYCTAYVYHRSASGAGAYGNWCFLKRGGVGPISALSLGSSLDSVVGVRSVAG